MKICCIICLDFHATHDACEYNWQMLKYISQNLSETSNNVETSSWSFIMQNLVLMKLFSFTGYKGRTPQSVGNIRKLSNEKEVMYLNKRFLYTFRKISPKRRETQKN